MTLLRGTEVAVAQPTWTTDRWRWLLLAAVAAVFAVFPFVATHPKSLSDLSEAVAAGSVSQVWVAAPLPPGASGYATAEVRWKRAGITHAASVMQVSDITTFDPGRNSPTDVVVGDVRQYLRSLAAAEGKDLVIEDATSSGGTVVFAFGVPAWVAGAAFVLWVLTLTLVVAGPTPWRATRWAWFWFVFSPLGLLAVPAFLALGGRLPWGRTEAPARRVTGGWSLIVVGVLTAAVNSQRWL